MANVNINRNVTDVFYRYKMPRLIAKVEGSGNEIKTDYPTKYFGCELGAQTQFDVKNDRYIVNGSHESSRLQELLDGFIKKFVLCPECENPETNLLVLTKKQCISQHCIACGHTANIDMRHKLTTFILKNPPESTEGTTGSSESSSTAVTPAGKKGGKKGKGGGKEENGGGGVVGGTERQNSSSAHENNHHSSSAGGENNGSSSTKRSSSHRVISNEDDDDDWGDDTSADAVRARMEGLTSGAKTLTINDDLEKSQQERVDIFYSFVKQKKMSDTLSGADREKEVVGEAERLDIKEKAPLVLAELLYDVNMLQQIKTYASLLKRFTVGNIKAQRYLLGGFEQLVGNVHPDVLLPKVPHILKTFYELDIIDEEALLEWDKKASKKFVSKEMSKEIHTKAAPFLTWLKEAEEESSDEDGDNDELEVVYTHSQAPGIVSVTTKTEPTNIIPAAHPHEEDINIDDI